MFVKEYGDGPRVFYCLHGWSGDHMVFASLVPYLPDDVRLCCADLPGCGASPDPERWELDCIADEVARSIEAVPADSVTLVGNCIGALVGLRAAMKIPHRVERLVLIDAFASWPWYFKVFTAPVWGKYAYATTFANPVGRWMTNRALASRRSEESDLTQGFSKRRHDVTLKYLHVVREIQSPDEFASLRVPADVVYGASTFQGVRESARVWRDLWPRTRVIEIPQAGHLVLQEAAGIVSKVIFEGGADDPADTAVGLSGSGRMDRYSLAGGSTGRSRDEGAGRRPDSGSR